MTENRGDKPAAGKPGGPEKRTDQDETEARRQADAKPKDPAEAQRQADATPKAGKPHAGKPNDDAPAGEELTGEGSPGLTIMGGGGHA
jgi:hypothetical protein